ncbi:tumor protein p53-inducible protein 13 isoform X2 [Denticeps clupeoides]|uniref:tumor protein p53-inducible protein 13 isoform X2 n=1 Tax=Denticeps clupeoides TaxID=299321 RepID=UPI0010A496CE|nr:tumor protein p53-inducible protein 13 isoform X2 [Denticeps clupeoides]
MLQFQVERDLLPAALLPCPGPPWPHRAQDGGSVDRRSPLQPAERVCMDTPISYNHTIPSSGAHRPVAAETGAYVYCPPQRWLNNLQCGAVVILHHPCAPLHQRGRLAELARSCLPHYIISAHPWLSTERPLALVSWGRTLEVSHVTASEVCDWLLSVSISLSRRSGGRVERYNMLLMQAGPPETERNRPLQLKIFRRCCEQALSQTTNEERNRAKRAVVEEQREELLDKHEAEVLNSEPIRPHTSSRPSPGVATPSTQRARESLSRTIQTMGVNPQAATEQTEKTGGVRAHRKRQRIKEDTEGQRLREEGRRRDAGERMSTPRTDEAVWAAAALGFLLVLLTLSVLHTRLYRHWRRSPSLYWHSGADDCDSVADVIRRRLKLVGRRKRRVPPGRRQEAALLHSSSTEEESD